MRLVLISFFFLTIFSVATQAEELAPFQSMTNDRIEHMKEGLETSDLIDPFSVRFRAGVSDVKAYGTEDTT